MISKITSLRYVFGEVQIFENFVIAIMDEGTTVRPEDNEELLKIANTYFSGRPFGYITHRINSYAVDPMVYLQTSKIDNLIAFAVVSTDGIKESNIELEKLFLSKPFRHFRDMEEAKEWIDEMVQDNRKKNLKN